MILSNIEDILGEYRAGKMVIITDDEDRENEGDLMICAEKVTPRGNQFYGPLWQGFDLHDPDRGALHTVGAGTHGW